MNPRTGYLFAVSLALLAANRPPATLLAAGVGLVVVLVDVVRWLDRR